MTANRARVRMWLNAEKALGLDSVRKPKLVVKTVSMSGPHPSRLPPRSIFDPEYRERERSAAPATPLIEEPQAVVSSSLAGPLEGPLLPLAERKVALAAIDAEVKICRRCALCEGRTNTVFGEGCAEAQIMFIGEAPGETEDQTGRPFVGKSGNLLDKMIAAMGLKREDVFIANIVKCRPPGNRVPAPDEVARCTPFLDRQLAIIRPRVIVTLGLPAAKYMLQSTSTMGRLRGQWQKWRGIKVMPTYHPSYVLRSYTEDVRAAVWSDLQKVMAEIGLSPKK